MMSSQKQGLTKEYIILHLFLMGLDNNDDDYNNNKNNNKNNNNVYLIKRRCIVPTSWKCSFSPYTLRYFP